MNEEQATDFQAQLNQLSAQLATVQAQLQPLSALAEQVTQLEENFLLVEDIYRFAKIREYLSIGQWQEADLETLRLIQEISGHQDLEELTPEYIKAVPCGALQVIDRLWLKYSNNRFGFSIQVRTYQSVGGSLETTVEQNRVLIEKWGEKLGWRENNLWRKCSELDYSLNAPEGCLPARWWNSPYGAKMTNHFLARLMNCEL